MTIGSPSLSMAALDWCLLSNELPWLAYLLSFRRVDESFGLPRCTLACLPNPTGDYSWVPRFKYTADGCWSGEEPLSR
jgi:hypothetical protein